MLGLGYGVQGFLGVVHVVAFEIDGLFHSQPLLLPLVASSRFLCFTQQLAHEPLAKLLVIPLNNSYSSTLYSPIYPL